jgi:hypothetical protein
VCERRRVSPGRETGLLGVREAFEIWIDGIRWGVFSGLIRF